MKTKQGAYFTTYLKKEDGSFVSLEQDARDFCEKWIKPVHPKNWDWTKRDFNNPKNAPTTEEAKVVRNLIYKDMSSKTQTLVDLSTLDNVDAIRAFLNPKSKRADFNLEEFAYSLEVELEHGKIRDANVTCNHPFLTAMIALAHMSETITYYKRLKVMETEGEIFEMMRKLGTQKKKDTELLKDLAKAEEDLIDARADLSKRLEFMDDIPILKEISD